MLNRGTHMNSKAKITITEAVRLTGKHPDTIRAFLKKHGDKTTKDEKGRILIPYELIKNYYDVPEQTTIFESKMLHPCECSVFGMCHNMTFCRCFVRNQPEFWLYVSLCSCMACLNAPNMYRSGSSAFLALRIISLNVLMPRQPIAPIM